ncbi:MAG: T9SS type A sorting domain-containing protein [Flavobacteriales bacterium]|nr:T9SS type A sorting domain-containing protein [Flavobacteriales bacterium]
MKTFLVIFCILFLFSSSSFSQFFVQDFDTEDPDPWYDALEVSIDSSSTLWQIGQPQKEIFDQALSLPNAILTDTLNPYPVADTSTFYCAAPLDEEWGFFGIVAFTWAQKLDIDSLDGGTVDFSVDGGQTWENAFTSPFVYNWYGWEYPENVDTLANETVVFSGKDSDWQEIWLCYDYSWLFETSDTLLVRFTFFSDTIPGNADGWMIDNMRLEPTFVHTVGEDPSSASYVNLYPNPVQNKLHIELKKSDQFHIIEELVVFSENGQVVKHFNRIPTKFFVDVSDLPTGIYEVLVRSNLKSEVQKVVISR